MVLPEDVVNVGSTGLVLASGHRAPGHLYLIDPATAKVQELIQVPAFRQRHDKRAYPSCPGPLNLTAFDTHGLSIAETSPRHFVLYTTSHGEREAIEIYELDLRGAAPVLTWTGCVPLQQDGYFNAVARLPPTAASSRPGCATHERPDECRRARRDERPTLRMASGGRLAHGRHGAVAAERHRNVAGRTLRLRRRDRHEGTAASRPQRGPRWQGAQ